MANGTGRPLRALAVMALGVVLWLAWRLPGMQADTQRLALALATNAPAPLVMAAAPEPPIMLRAVPAASGPMLLGAAPAPSATAAPVTMRRPPADPPVPAPIAPLPAAIPSPSAPTASAPAVAPLPPVATSFDLANRAYALKQAGYRRAAAEMFAAALALDPGNRQWQRERAQLARRWQAGGFALLRDSPANDNTPGSGLPGFAASPLLGGGQVGGSIAFLADPYARRPLAVVARFNMAADPAGVRPETAQAAIGLRQTLLPGVTLSAERLFALGDAARGDWTLRLAAGGRSGRLEAYAEAGMLGSGGAYAGAQATARIIRAGPATLNTASWASLQTGAPDAWRVDVGPSITADWHGVRVAADWRQRVAGNAAPGSGPVLTVSAGF